MFFLYIYISIIVLSNLNFNNLLYYQLSLGKDEKSILKLEYEFRVASRYLPWYMIIIIELNFQRVELIYQC